MCYGKKSQKSNNPEDTKQIMHKQRLNWIVELDTWMLSVYKKTKGINVWMRV
jgi:hypothetical protein